jgi:hypothetical protein
MNRQQNSSDAGTRRAGVRRTVWTVALIAVAIYLGFMLSGTLGR